MAAARRPPIYGPEPWDERYGQVWSNYLSDDAPAKLAHLDGLTARLQVAGRGPAGLLRDDPLDRTVLTKARRKVPHPNARRR